MKTLLLLAPLALAATVAAADLKEPATVARDWNRAVKENPPPLVADLGLRATNPPASAFQVWPPTETPEWNPRKNPAPFSPLIRPPGYQDGPAPRGAKPYQFNGETYWLIPILENADA